MKPYEQIELINTLRIAGVLPSQIARRRKKSLAAFSQKPRIQGFTVEKSGAKPLDFDCLERLAKARNAMKPHKSGSD
jgi:hypothetical protein